MPALVEDKIGAIRKGLYADLLVIRSKGKDPYQALLHSDPTDVRLVIVGGAPLYGDPDLMTRLLPG